MAHPVQRPGELIQGINVTPLVDVVLVLLIVLMLSVSYSVSRSLPMQLMRAREAVMKRFRPHLTERGLTDQQWRVIRPLSLERRTVTGGMSGRE